MKKKIRTREQIEEQYRHHESRDSFLPEEWEAFLDGTMTEDQANAVNERDGFPVLYFDEKEGRYEMWGDEPPCLSADWPTLIIIIVVTGIAGTALMTFIRSLIH